jgi:CBS domain containing-hemolysin-like protein
MELNSEIILLVFVGLTISFISGVEAAYYSASRLAIELKKKQNKYTGKIWWDYFQNPSKFVASAILVFNFLLVVYSYLWWNILETVWTYWALENIYVQLILTILFSSVSLLIVMFIVRPIFHARSTSVLSSGFVTFLVASILYLFRWIAESIVSASKWILKYIFNVKLSLKSEVFSKPDIDTFIQLLRHNEQSENLEKNNEIFENIVGLSDVKLKACLVPRREIIGVKDKVSIDEIIRVFSETKLSKLVVYDETIDNIKGYIHQLDLLKDPTDLQSILLPIPVVPESMNARDLIKKFSRERKSIAWVIDEFGGTAGIVTMEDLLEEIFGDINDEFDASEDFVAKQVAPNEYLFSGRVALQDISEKYKLNFRRGEGIETLSGYIINQSGGIPRQRDRIIVDDYQFDIVSVTKTRIEAVKLKILR